MPSINLIPPQQKAELKRTLFLSRWLRSATLVLVLSLLGTGIAVTAWQMMRQRATTVHQELVQLEQDQAKVASKDISDKTNELNTTITMVAKTLGQPQRWSADAVTVLSAVPAGNTVHEVSLQTDGRFRLIGVADTRSSFLALDQSIKTNARFSQVKTTSAPSKRTAVPFDYTGVLNPATQP